MGSGTIPQTLLNTYTALVGKRGEVFDRYDASCLGLYPYEFASSDTSQHGMKDSERCR